MAAKMHVLVCLASAARLARLGGLRLAEWGSVAITWSGRDVAATSIFMQRPSVKKKKSINEKSMMP